MGLSGDADNGVLRPEAYPGGGYIITFWDGDGEWARGS